MRINTNVAAINTHRSLTMTGSSLGKSLGRLSTGFRINRAADDAAGLGISNQLRADTRALQQASRNAEQANSMLQVMESASGKIQGILERMKELATQSASDNVDANGRSRIDAEFQALYSEIDRIVSTTKFQGQTLVDGTFGNYVDVDNSDVITSGVASSIKLSGTAVGTYTFSVDGGANTVSITDADGNSQTMAYTGAERTITFRGFGVTVNLMAGSDVDDLDGLELEVAGSQASFMVSSSGNYTGSDLVDMTSVNLTNEALGLDGVGDLLTAENARDGLSLIDAAIDTVNSALGEIGALQNRLEFALENVQASVENFAAAESVIRDVDFASEMTEFTKFQILQQAGIAMLSQANAAPQAVLALLR